MAKILVVEDEKDLAEMIAMDLKSAGYEVVIAYDGEDGLNQARTIKPDLIVLDVNLPKLSGFNVSESLKAENRYKAIPIIMLTVRNTKIEEKIGYAMGADDYLAKPYQAAVLIAKIKKFIK